MILLRAIFFLLLISCSKSKITTDPAVTPPSQPKRIVNVSTSAQLQAALLDARPGDEIVLRDGVYSGKFVVGTNVPGNVANRVVLRGSRNAVLDAGTINTGYVLYLQSDYWTIKGITITNGLKGIMADGVHYNIIDSVKLTGIGEEAIHLRKYSSHNIIQNVEITNTGLKTPDYGEGVYIGSAKNNWATYTNGNPDLCDSNSILNNKIGPGIAAECIDIKEGTTGGIVKENSFDATGITGANSADSWIDVKGNYWLVESNTGYNPTGSLLKDGYQVHVAYAGWGNYNEFKNNICTVNAAGYGFNISLTSSNGTAVGNKVYSNNQVTGAASGVSNIPLTN
jgi:hypothetical protein